MQRDRHLSVLRSFVYKARTITNSAREAIAHRGLGPPLNRYIVRPVTASKSRACREGHTSGPCQWLFSDRIVGMEHTRLEPIHSRPACGVERRLREQESEARNQRARESFRFDFIFSARQRDN